MPTNSSVDKRQNVHSWCRLPVAWPVEKVVIEVEVEEPREITIFEWALVRVLEEFPERTPTLAAAAEVLGIKTPVFLEEALQSLVQLGAIEFSSSDQPLDLPNCRLNTQGRRLLRGGRMGGLPERHGLLVHFDAVSGEHIREPRNLRDQTTRPVIASEQLPARVSQIGLDRVRRLAQAQGEPFHNGESRIRAANVQPEVGGHAWLPMEVALEINRDGVLGASLQNANEAQRDWFLQRDLIMFDGLERASTGSWANGHCHTRPSSLAAERWFASAARPIAPSATADEARQAVRDAESEVVLHAGWLDAPQMEETLGNAAERGVRCYVGGVEPSLTHWSVPDRRAPGFVISGDSPSTARPLAIVVDGARGLRVDLVCARSPGGRELNIEIAAFIRNSDVGRVRQLLLGGLPESLDDSDDQQEFAAFALSGDLNHWKRIAQRIWSETDGLERIANLRTWAAWGRQVAGEAGTEELNDWVVRSWRAAFLAAIDGPSGRVDPVLDAGVGLVAPSEVLTQLVERIESIPVLEDATALCDLLEAAVSVGRRWPTFDPIESCRSFTQVLRSTFNGADAARHGSAMRAAAEAVGRNSELRPAHDLCARLLSAGFPKPHDLASFVAWLEAHVPLARFLGPTFHDRARRHLRTFQFELSATRDPADLAAHALERAWDELRLPAADLAGLADSHRNSASPAKQPRQSNQPRKEKK